MILIMDIKDLDKVSPKDHIDNLTAIRGILKGADHLFLLTENSAVPISVVRRLASLPAENVKFFPYTDEDGCRKTDVIAMALACACGMQYIKVGANNYPAQKAVYGIGIEAGELPHLPANDDIVFSFTGIMAFATNLTNTVKPGTAKPARTKKSAVTKSRVPIETPSEKKKEEPAPIAPDAAAPIMNPPEPETAVTETEPTVDPVSAPFTQKLYSILRTPALADGRIEQIHKAISETMTTVSLEMILAMHLQDKDLAKKLSEQIEPHFEALKKLV